MIIDFSQNLPPLTAEETYAAFLNSLRFREGFGIIFLQCSPGEANRLIPRVRRELPDKNIEALNLVEPINNLYRLVEGRTDRSSLNILFVRGLEKSLEADIKPGYKGLGDYYNLNTVPPILSHLNQQRENFRDHFGNICFVFVLPRFAIRYFVRRAPDFYDWNSGVFEISDDFLSPIDTIKPKEFEGLESDHFTSQGWLFYVLGKNEEAIESFDHALEIRPDEYTWHYRGMALSDAKRYEEAIVSYDKAVEINPCKDESWFNRGNALSKLGRYKEAIESYDKTIAINPGNPDNYESFNNRGTALNKSGLHEEAVLSYDKALAINPSSYEAWYNRGATLSIARKYAEAVISYEHALKINPQDHRVWNNKGIAEFLADKHGDALTTWRKTFQLIHSFDSPQYNDISKIIQEFIEELIPRFTQPPIQQTLLIPLLEIYREAQVITELGAALVNTLHLIIDPAISDQTAAQWLTFWRTSSLGSAPAMELPLRLMETAIEYKKDPSQRLWLNLPQEERPILDKALKLLD